jgi:hypothetical protein
LRPHLWFYIFIYKLHIRTTVAIYNYQQYNQCKMFYLELQYIQWEIFFAIVSLLIYPVIYLSSGYLILTHTLNTFLKNFLQHWGLNSGPAPWAIPPAIFLMGGLSRQGLTNNWPVWLWTWMLPISASWVARTIGESHQHPAEHLLSFS